MKIRSARIKNFRGIVDTTIDLDNDIPGQVVTLIGLNESGKTTILEAISNFVSTDTDTQTLVENYYTKIDSSGFVPKHRRGRFTDTVSIICEVELNDEDVKTLAKTALAQTNAIIDQDKFPRTIVVEKRFTFSDSKLTNQGNYWTFTVDYMKKNGTKHYKGRLNSDKVWMALVKKLNPMLPAIVYFPTFLFDVPDRIYLEEIEEESIQNAYYRKVFQDILRTVDPEYSIQKHIVKRVKEAAEASGTEKFFRALLGASIEGDIDTVVREVSNEASKVIIGAWDEIFGRKLLNKRIEFAWDFDPNQSNAVYVELYIIDGQSKYLLKERSLGFRWFFSFLLFTQFRRSGLEGRPSIYLFDEPASHLHSGAQIKLLESFEKICGPDDLIVYSTHSHYMVNPLWLEKAYIVDNKAIDLASDDFDQFSTKPNEIEAIRYRSFVSDNPSRTTYFQPVFDALRYQVSPLSFRGPAVFLEGKFDFHPFAYFAKRLGADPNLAIFPANGAGDMATLISLFRGWAVPFIILLDDDAAGRREAKRYKDEYSLTDDELINLGDLVPKTTGKAFEALYGSDVERLIEKNGFKKGRKLKQEASQLFQHLIALDDYEAPVARTAQSFELLIRKLSAALDLKAPKESKAKRKR